MKILIGDKLNISAIDAVLLDSSPDGMRVRTTAPITVPDWVTLKFRDGETARAQRCWQRGGEIGFKVAAVDSRHLLDALIKGLSFDQRRALIARIEASLVED